MSQRPWTPAETAEILKLWEAGATNADMREALDRSKNSVACKLRSMGLPMGDERQAEAPEPCEIHLRNIGRNGFLVVTEPVLSRCFALERPMPRKRFFHEAA